MRNIFINNYRKVVRDQTFVDTKDNLYHLNLPRDAAFESTESAYDLKEMHRIVNALPREYKIPFSMHVSGFKYREIAEKLGLPLGTVKSRIYFTRQKLQQDLNEFVYEIQGARPWKADAGLSRPAFLSFDTTKICTLLNLWKSLVLYAEFLNKILQVLL